VSALPMLIIIPLLLFAVLSALAGVWRQKLAHYLAVLGTMLSLIAALEGVITVLNEGKQSYHLGGWPPPFGIEYILDPLSAFMTTVVLFVGFIIMIYLPKAGFYHTPAQGIPAYALMLLLLGGLTGVILTGDLFNLFVFLEIYSLASYTLITMSGKRALVAGFRYLILGTIAGSFYLLGVGFLYFSTGTLNMADVARLLPDIYTSPSVLAAVALIVTGLAIKMALFPLHVWLPDAHSYAPPSVAAILASLQIEVAAYALIRMFLDVFRPVYLFDILSIHTIIAWCGVAGIIFGSVMAIPQRDFKRMLAYSTVGQMGYIALGIGLANPLGMIGALLHILNHAFMKSCLFLVAGGIRYQTGLREIPWFAGLGRRMPITMAAFNVAALSMIGIPPTAGFFSKWYLILGSIDAGNWIFVAAILLSSLLNAVYFFSVIERVYAKPPAGNPELIKATDPPLQVLLPILTLAAGVIILGLTNAFIVTRVINLVVAGLY